MQNSISTTKVFMIDHRYVSHLWFCLLFSTLTRAHTQIKTRTHANKKNTNNKPKYPVSHRLLFPTFLVALDFFIKLKLKYCSLIFSILLYSSCVCFFQILYTRIMNKQLNYCSLIFLIFLFQLCLLCPKI